VETSGQTGGQMASSTGFSSNYSRLLAVGDLAPALSVNRWVRGPAISGFRSDQTYVVEFWATWCAPCRVAIPHLNELQQRRPDVPIIAVAASENDGGASIDRFVADQGMATSVALATDGRMLSDWLVASGQVGIPVAFIVDKGRVTWVGSPMQVESNLPPAPRWTGPDWICNLQPATVRAARPVAQPVRLIQVPPVDSSRRATGQVAPKAKFGKAVAATAKPEAKSTAKSSAKPTAKAQPKREVSKPAAKESAKTVAAKPSKAPKSAAAKPTPGKTILGKTSSSKASRSKAGAGKAASSQR
jgi:thiol-disulfide isomerase/thioredoxin